MKRCGKILVWGVLCSLAFSKCLLINPYDPWSAEEIYLDSLEIYAIPYENLHISWKKETQKAFHLVYNFRLEKQTNDQQYITIYDSLHYLSITDKDVEEIFFDDASVRYRISLLLSGKKDIEPIEKAFNLESVNNDTLKAKRIQLSDTTIQLSWLYIPNSTTRIYGKNEKWHLIQTVFDDSVFIDQTVDRKQYRIFNYSETKLTCYDEVINVQDY